MEIQADNLQEDNRTGSIIGYAVAVTKFPKNGCNRLAKHSISEYLEHRKKRLFSLESRPFIPMSSGTYCVFRSVHDNTA